MSLSDPIGDMIARIKNAQSRNHKVELPSSNFKVKIADILKNEGFIKEFKVNSDNNKSTLSLELNIILVIQLLTHLNVYLNQVEEFFQVQKVF